MKRHVIIGNGVAALSALTAIRGYTSDPITVISAEKSPAYGPMLTPYYISGRIPREAMFLCDHTFYQQKQVQTRLGSAAVRVQPWERKVCLDDGSSIDYDYLLIATGAYPVVPPIKGCDLSGVCTLRTETDAERIKALLPGTKRVAIVGAGLIGMHMMDALRRLGKRVAVVETADRVLPAVLDQRGSAILQELMEKEGIALYLKSQVADIEGAPDGMVLHLESGIATEAELVIVATGVVPNTSLVNNSGVKVGRGIIVNEYSQTSVPNVYAAGDVAELVDSTTRKSQLAPTWVNAVLQGRTAGLNMAGFRVPLARLNRVNISTILGLAMASIGSIQGEGEGYQTVSYKEDTNYRYLCFDKEHLVGAVLIGDVSEIGVLTNIMERFAPCPDLRRAVRQGAFIIADSLLKLSRFSP